MTPSLVAAWECQCTEERYSTAAAAPSVGGWEWERLAYNLPTGAEDRRESHLMCSEGCLGEDQTLDGNHCQLEAAAAVVPSLA